MRRTTLGALALSLIAAATGCTKTDFADPPVAPPVVDTTPPSEVTNLTATAGPNAGEVTLAWTASISADTLQYIVTVTPQGGSALTPIIVTPASATGVVVPGLASGVSHTFLVQVEDTNGNISAGTSVVQTPASLIDVTSLTAIPGNGQVVLQWNPSASPGVTQYQVVVTDLSTSIVVQTVFATPGTATGITITGLTNGINYSFLVRAMDANNNTSPGVSVTGQPSSAADTQPPTNVTNLAAIPSSGQVTLTWTPATDNVGVVSYTVTVTDLVTSTVVQTFSVTPGSATGTTVTGLTNGVAYRFTIVSVDPSNNLSSGVFVDATPGNPSVDVAYSSPGGAYRTPSPPTITLTGVVNGHQVTGAGTGVVFYTVDGSNPIVVGARAPNATGVADATGSSAGTFVQNNPTAVGLQLGAGLTATQFGPTAAAATSTVNRVDIGSGTFPLNGTIRAGDVVRITANTTGGALVGETATIQNNGVAGTSLTVGAGFSGAPDATTSFIVERTQRSVVVRAFYDPAGTVGPPATSSTSAGVTATSRYFFFNQAANTFVPYGGMVRPRWRHTSTLLKSGAGIDSVVLFGGELSGSVIEEIYDRDTQFFFGVTSSPFGASVARQESAAVRLDTPNQDVLVLGGRRQATIGNLAADLLAGANRAVRYDPVVNSLTDVSTNFVQRTLHTATVLTNNVSSNSVLVTGGLSGTAGATPTADATSSASVIDLQVAVLSLGDVVEVTSGPSAGETAVVIQILVPPVTSSQSVLVSPAFSSTVAGQTIRQIIINDNSAQLFAPGTNTWGPGAANRLTGLPAGNAGTDAEALVFTGGVDMRRWGHGAALLQNGLVLITGGHLETPVSGTNDIEQTLLLFDPTDTTNDPSGTFRVAGFGVASGFRDNSARIQHQKFFHSTTLLKDGKVLIAGGVSSGTGYFANNYTGASVRSSADLFDPSNETTAKVGNCTGRFFHTATLLNDGRVLLAGGANAIDGQSGGVPIITGSAELYDPLTGTFAPTAQPMLTTRIWHAASLLPDGRVLITGGTGAALPEVFDPSTGTFSATAGTATADRSFGGAAAVTHRGNVLVAGGQHSNFAGAGAGVVPGAITGVAEVYNVNLSRFQLTPGMAFARRFHTATTLDDGRVLVAGGEGHLATGSTPTALGTVESYNETTNAWTTENPMSGGRYGHTATMLRGPVLHTTGTATFNGTTTVTGTTTSWLTDGVAAGDRIRLDSNGIYFEIVAVASDTSLTIAGPIGGFWPSSAIPSGTGAYTIRSENAYTNGTATFTFGLATVTGTGTNWTRTVRAGDLIRPTGAGIPLTTYQVASVTNDTTITLTAAYTGATVAAGAYRVAGPGRLLVVGGGPQGSPLNTGELFDPISNNWVSVTNQMALGRYAHTATRLANGMVLIVGGNNNFDRTAELYDPAMNRFAQLVIGTIGTAVTAAARNNHQSALLANGNVFICGGDIGQSAVEIFTTDSDGNAATDNDGDGFGSIDFTNNTFSSTGTVNMSVGRVNHTLAVLPASGAAGSVNQLLIVGGKGSALNTADLYDVATTQTTASIALGRQNIEFHTATVLPVNGNVLIIRGHTAQVFFSQ